VLSRADRREWAVLGLVALAWGLLVAPLVHREAHSHAGGKHSHGPAKSGEQHGVGSLEHQAVSFVAAPVVQAPVLVAVAVGVPRVAVPEVVALSRLRRVEQSQAP
jgi:hypothetical protein